MSNTKHTRKKKEFLRPPHIFVAIVLCSAVILAITFFHDIQVQLAKSIAALRSLCDVIILEIVLYVCR